METRIAKIFQALNSYIEIPETELEYQNPYTLLVAVVLSAQSTDRQVNKVTERMFLEIDSPEKMINMGLNNLLESINSIGLYKTKGKNIIALSHILINKFNSQVPDNREDLMSLPGVGRKSADVMLNIVYNQPTVAVDTHVFRVCTRLAIATSHNRDKMAEELANNLPKYLPDSLMNKAHHLLVLHGRYICKAKNPHCIKCPIAHLCASRDKKI